MYDIRYICHWFILEDFQLGVKINTINGKYYMCIKVLSDIFESKSPLPVPKRFFPFKKHVFTEKWPPVLKQHPICSLTLPQPNAKIIGVFIAIHVVR